MKNKTLYIFMLSLLSGAVYSQTNANPNIIKKDITIRQGIDIIDYYNPNNSNQKPSPKIVVPVYYNKKFYTTDILKKISLDSIENMEIIQIPDSISKDLRSFIYIRKKDRKN